jgi:hypothetical protein
MSAHHEGSPVARPAGRRGLGAIFAILLILAAAGAAVWVILKYGPVLGSN